MPKPASKNRLEVERLMQFLNEVHIRLDQAIKGLTSMELNWRPSANSNSIGNLIKHIAGAEAFWIHHVIGGMETNRVRISEFEIKEFRIANLREELIRIKDTTNQVLTTLADTDLDRPRTYWSQLANLEKTVAVHWSILHVIAHSALHTGQIFYIRKMYADHKPQ